MKFRTLLTAVALAAPGAALALSPAMSGQTAGSSRKMQMPESSLPGFRKADTNGDGKIEWQEAKAVGVPKKLFKQDDFRQTGKLTRSEWHFVRIEMPAGKNPPGTA